MEVPFVDLRPMHDPLAREIADALARPATRSFFILGHELEAFEAEYAHYHHTKHALGVGNGLDALTLALRALGIGTGDEVITSAHTYIATILAIIAAGATPVLVDAQPDTLAIDPDAVRAAITPRTAAILPVHLYGRVVDMPPLLELAHRHGLAIIEDVAQAHGAELAHTKAGALGTVGCFSFYPTKNLGAWGDGGAIITQDDHLAHKIKQLRNYGSNEKYVHDTLGVNSRLDEIQAALLRVKLPHLDRWNTSRRALAHHYYQELAGIIDFPAQPRPSGDGKDHVFHLLIARTSKRDQLRDFLQTKGIQTAIHYPIPAHRQKALAHLGHQAGAFPIAEAAAQEIVSLPLFPGMTSAQQDAVIQAIKRFATES